jgi:hypothetical protein
MAANPTTSANVAESESVATTEATVTTQDAVNISGDGNSVTAGTESNTTTGSATNVDEADNTPTVSIGDQLLMNQLAFDIANNGDPFQDGLLDQFEPNDEMNYHFDLAMASAFDATDVTEYRLL